MGEYVRKYGVFFFRAELGLESPSYGESQKHTGIFGQVQSGEAGVRKSRGVGPPHPRPLSPTGGEGRISVFSWVLYAKGCGMGARAGKPELRGNAMSGSKERSSGVIK